MTINNVINKNKSISYLICFVIAYNMRFNSKFKL